MRPILTFALAALVVTSSGLAGARAQGIAAGASVECDPVGVGNYRSAIVKEVSADGKIVTVDLDDYTPNGKFVTCPAEKLRVVPREAFTKGPPAAYGLYHSGDRVECGESLPGIGASGSVVTLVDPKGVYLVLFDGSDPEDKPRTCEGAQLKRFSGAPVGLRGFKK